MSETIDSCPFCGEVNITEFGFNGEGPPPSYAVYCDNCGAHGPHGMGANRHDHEGARQKAVILWNQRELTTENAALKARLVEAQRDAVRWRYVKVRCFKYRPDSETYADGKTDWVAVMRWPSLLGDDLDVAVDNRMEDYCFTCGAKTERGVIECAECGMASITIDAAMESEGI